MQITNGGTDSTYPVASIEQVHEHGQGRGSESNAPKYLRQCAQTNKYSLYIQQICIHDAEYKKFTLQYSHTCRAEWNPNAYV